MAVKTVNLIAGNLSHVVPIGIMDDGSAPGNTSANIDKKQNKVSDKSPSLGYDLIPRYGVKKKHAGSPHF